MSVLTDTVVRRALITTISVVACCCYTSALADIEDATAKESPARDPALEALERRIGALEEANKQLAAERAAERAERKKAPVVKAAPGAGLSVGTADGKFTLQIRARAVIRETVFAPYKAPTTNEINVKTLRLYFQGNVLLPDLRYFIQLALSPNDFEAGNPSPIYDAFVDWGKWRFVKLRLGQYFVPFDRARTIREFALQLVDRQQVVQELTLDRDVGLTVYSNEVARGRLGYYVGIYGGEGRNRFGGQNPGFLYVMRLVVRPWGDFDDEIEGDLERLRRPRLAIGIAGAYNQNALRTRSTIGTNFTLGDNSYIHGAADLVFKFAGFSLLSEFVVRKALWNNRTGVDAMMNPITEWSRSGYGYIVQAGMMVHRLVEVAARWDHLFAFADTDPALVRTVATIGKQAGVGLNLYLNGHLFKFQTDYFYQFGDIAENGNHLFRIQLDATF